MKKKNIFLSYRRDDNPGYVSKLEHDLEQAFGHGRVFRDVDDIEGGTKWKDVLQQNLENAGALLVIIGPRWEAIWNERDDHNSDYIVYELEKAKELGVPIIPVTLNGTKLAPSLDLGPVEWLLDNQMYDISDHQGRWSTDLAGLIGILENYDSIGKSTISSLEDAKIIHKKPIWKYVILATVCLIVLLQFLPSDPGPESEKAISREAIIQPGEVEPAATVPDKPVNVPDIAGNWLGNDGALYVVEQFPDGTFIIESPDYGSGLGAFMTKMPNKFRVTMQGTGHGEYSVSTDGQRITGWFIEEGTSQQQYETLIRVE